MTNEELFRCGFLSRCAQEGCSIEEVQRRVKVATAMLQRMKQADAAAAGSNWLKTMRQVALDFPTRMSAAGIFGSGIAGAGIGYGLAKMQDADVNPEDAKRQELLAVLRRHTMMANQRAATLQQPPTPPPIRNLFNHGVM